MSVFLDNLKELQIYRNRFHLPMNPKDRLHGSAVFLFTKTLTDSIDLMQNPIFINLRTFVSYYLERDVMFYINESHLVPYRDTDNEILLESLTKKERDSIPEDEFGLPEERKFPLDTPEHIKSAIHLFGHCPEDKKHELAKRIMKAAAKHGIEVDEKSQVYKYATQHAIEEKPVNEEVEYFEETRSKPQQKHFYFYHMVPKKSNMKNGILSMQYMYDHDMNDLLDNSLNKYRKRMSDKDMWGYYPDTNPEDLTQDQLIKGLQKYRGKDALNKIYFFRYAPYSALGPNMKSTIAGKDIYRIDLNDPRVQKLIKKVDWGYVGSNNDNERLTKDWYEKVTKDDYFKDYDDKSKMNFASMNHIGISPIKGNIPLELIEKVNPDTIEEEYIEEGFLNPLEFYHASPDKFDKYLIANSFNMGNNFNDPSWSVFLFKNKEYPIAYGVSFTVFNLAKKIYGKEFAKEHGMKSFYTKGTNYKFTVISNEYANELRDALDKYKPSFYVYTVKPNLNELTFGHNKRLPEYTSNKDLEITHTEKIVVTPEMFDKYIKPVSKSEYKKNEKESWKIVARPFFSDIYYHNEKKEPGVIDWIQVKIEIKKMMKEGKIKPGDDLSEIIPELKKKYTYEDTDLTDEQLSLLKEEATYEVINAYKHVANNTSVIEESFAQANIDGKEFQIYFNEALDEILNERSAFSSQGFSNKFRSLLYKERIKTQKEQFVIYDYIRSRVGMIAHAYIDYERYKKKNLFIDMAYYMNSFFKNNMFRLDTAVDLFLELASRSFHDKRLSAAGYDRKTVLVPLDKWCHSADLAWDYHKELNPVSAIVRMVQRKDLSLLKEKWGGIDFVFLTKTSYMKLNLDNISLEVIPKFKTLISKIIRNDINDINAIERDSSEVITSKFIARLSRSGVNILNLSGGTSELTPAEVKKRMKIGLKPKSKEEKKAQLVQKVKDIADQSTSEEDLMDNIDKSPEDKEWLANVIADLQSEGGPDISKTRQARLNKANEDFLEKSIKGRKIKDMLAASTSQDIPTDNIPIDSMNEDWKEVKFSNFSKAYDLDADIVSIMNSMIDKTRPLAIIDINKEDNSTSEDYIETWTVKFEDVNGKRHTVKLDVPKFINGRLMKLRGNLKTIQGQLVLLPIIKTDEDTAQIVSNYNKIFIRRVNPSNGTKSTPDVSKITKILDKYKGSSLRTVYGDNAFISGKYEVPIDYRDLSANYSKIEFKDGSFIGFNMDDMNKLAEQLKVGKTKETKDLEQPIWLYYDKPTNKIRAYPNQEIGYTVLSILEEKAIKYKDEELLNLIKTVKPSDKLSYTVASIMTAVIPVIVLMAYSEGLQTAMKKGGVEYEFTEKRPPSGTAFIKFSDGYITYKPTLSSSLLMMGLQNCPTQLYSIKDINKKEMWLDFIEDFGGKYKAEGLDNFYDLMMDPITKEICELYHLPTDYVEVLGYASALLSDNKYNKHVDISGNRIRTNEIIAGYVYKAISQAYGEYNTMLGKSKNDAVIAVKQSAVIDMLLEDPTASDFSVMSPLLEAEANYALSFKGLSGMNAERSYSLDKRVYDKSMYGVLASSTGFAGNIGITRQASINAGVKGTRGIIVPPKEKNTLNILGVTEGLKPFASTHDDPIRLAMNYIQTSKHQMRTNTGMPNLVTTGMDEAMPYITSNIFSYKFEGKKGKVLDVTDDFIVYEDTDTKERHFVNLKEQPMKNSSAGFYVTLKLSPNVRKGQIIKNKDILAYDKTSFSPEVGIDPGNNGQNIAYNAGTLIKLGIYSTADGYEDSTIVTESLAEAMSIDYTVKKDRFLPKNTNVYSLIQKGTPIQEGDPLIVFQNAFDEKDANSLLKAITDDEMDAVTDLGRIHVRSKLSGIVQDVKIYRTCDLDELSPSLKKICMAYERGIKADRKYLEKYKVSDIEQNEVLEPDYKLEAQGKLKGMVDGVYIEFYLQAHDKLGIGDKLVHNGGLKGVIYDVIPKGKEPTTDFRPNEFVSASMSVSSSYARMVTSIILNGLINKVLIELDRACKEDLGIKWKPLQDMYYKE